MAEKEAENVQGGVSHGKREAAGRIVLVGTYKGDVPEDAERVIIRTATLAANHPDTNVINDDTTLEAA